MDRHNIKIEIKDFRAIKKASIVLDGITVITGENGSGKSSISKLLYHSIKTSINYDKIIDEKSNYDLLKVYDLLEILFRELSYLFDREKSLSIKKYLRNIRNNTHQPNLFGEENSLLNIIDALIKLLDDLPKNDTSTKFNVRINRIKRILINEVFFNNSSINELSIEDLLEKLKVHTINLSSSVIKQKEKRPINILYDILNEVFYDNPINNTFNIFEYGVQILDKTKKRINDIHTIQNIAYIDTPMIIGIPTFAERTHWDDLNNLLQTKQKTKKSPILDILKNEIIKGDISNDNDDLVDKDFVYLREDGAEFDLLECATGLKSFAIIQILHKNNILNNKTLLIIDEPEVHLHPQWVVEYARLIVLLNKYFGVKFLIASHHPDMISAIKYISLKEKTDDILNFYLAEKIGNTFMYNYVHKKTDLEDIFTSFNIAFERIDLYGKTE